MDDNIISYLADRSLSHLTSLLELDLSSNRLSKLEAQTFSGQGSLTTLRLTRNPLRYLYAGALAGLSSLRELYLDRVPGREASVDRGALIGLGQLDKLYMAGSRALIAMALAGPSTSDTGQLALPERILVTLDLDDCKAETLGEIFVDYLEKYPPDTLRLTSDVWRCDTRMERLAEWLRNTHTAVNPKKYEYDEITAGQYDKDAGEYACVRVYACVGGCAYVCGCMRVCMRVCVCGDLCNHMCVCMWVWVFMLR